MPRNRFVPSVCSVSVFQRFLRVFLQPALSRSATWSEAHCDIPNPRGWLARRIERREFSVLTTLLSGLEQIDINKWVTIKSFAIIQSFGVQPVAPVEFE